MTTLRSLLFFLLFVLNTIVYGLLLSILGWVLPDSISNAIANSWATVTLWLPVGRWQRADGTAINGNGVEPDEVVDLAAGEDEADPVLDRALELAVQSLEQAA